MGALASDGRITIARPIDDVRPWLLEPELMVRWMVGVISLTSLDASKRLLRLEAGGGRGATVYSGAVTTAGERQVVRRWTLSGMADEYVRTVTYDLIESTTVICTVSTIIPGIADAHARMGAHAETKSLERSLARLRDLAEGRRVGLLARGRDGSFSPQPL